VSAEVSLTQFMRPSGRPEMVRTTVSDEQGVRAIDMVLTCEVLMTGPVAIYGRFNDEEEEDEIVLLATNHPGPKQPDIVTGDVIDAVWKRRYSREKAS
jgi:hypothetical protein